MTPSYDTPPAPPPYDPWASASEPTRLLTPVRPQDGARRPLGLVAATALLAGTLGGGVGAGITVLATDPPAPVSTSATAASAGTTRVALPAGSVAAVAADVLPSVVSIQVSSGSGSGSGSGVVLSSDGRVLTNNHVVEAAAEGGAVRVVFSDGTRAPARIVGRDPGSDLAVIQAQGVSGRKPATLGRSADLQVGQGVVAIGSPLGLSGTVTEGIVSAKNRPVRAGSGAGAGAEGAVLDAIQTDAAVNPGNSGGALANLRGEVVGVNSAIASLGAGAGGQSGSIGLGFAIPIDQARRIAEELVADGSAGRAQLGISVAESEDGGARLAEVTPGGAAAAAELRAGDVVTRLGDRRIDDPDSLVAAVRSAVPGSQVTLTYVRDGRTATARATLGTAGG